MSLRRIAVVCGFLALAACRPSVGESPSSVSFVDYAVFNPSQSEIPQPNDLSLQAAATLPAGAQKEFLGLLAAQGGFPNDQEVPITIGFVRQPVGGSPTPLPLDTGTVKLLGAVPSGATVAVMQIKPGAPTPVAVDSAYDATTGTLTLRNKPQANGSRAWTAGAQYAVFVLGGSSGLMAQGGGTVSPMPTFAILQNAIVNNIDLTQPVNQALLPGTASQKAAAGAQLNQIRLAYTPLVPLAALIGMPIQNLVSLQTFTIAPLSSTSPTVVAVDPSSGKAPLPFDPLIDPTTGKIAPNPAFGAASAGLSTLDGFSTTAMILAPTSTPGSTAPTAGLVVAATVNASTVFLYKLGANGAATTQLLDVAAAITGGKPGNAAYVTQPPQIQVPCGPAKCSPVIGLQPAVPAALPSPSTTTLFLPPLEEKTEYAVVITDGVKDLTGKGLGRSTFANIVLGIENPVFANGASQLAGISNSQAQSIEQMRTALAPVFSALPSGVTKDNVKFAYTFRTQSVTGTSVQLSAAPYANQSASVGLAPQTSAPFDPATVGLPMAGFPDVQGFLSATLVTLDAIDPATGALQPDSTKWKPTPIPALIAVPKVTAAGLAACPAPASALKCAPLVVFQHGLNGGHLQVLPIANALAKAGFVVASIDAPYHGDRAFCNPAATGPAQCVSNSDNTTPAACDLDPTRAGQGDPAGASPGTCAPGSHLALSTDPTRLLSTVASGNYFISGNFFRLRDGFRQELLDQSALTLNLARPPAPFPQPAANPVNAALQAAGIAIDPTRVYWAGISLGSIMGTEVLATNPRFSRGALNVPGGTLVDIFTNAPSFTSAVDALFAALIPGFTPEAIDPTNPAFNPVIAAEYLQTLQVAKWILDPAEPVNYAKHLKTKIADATLTSALGPLGSTTTEAWFSFANGDETIPNPFNFELQSNTGTDAIGTGALPATLYSTTPGPAAHGFLFTSVAAQDAIATFLTDGTTTPGPTATP